MATETTKAGSEDVARDWWQRAKNHAADVDHADARASYTAARIVASDQLARVVAGKLAEHGITAEPDHVRSDPHSEDTTDVMTLLIEGDTDGERMVVPIAPAGTTMRIYLRPTDGEPLHELRHQTQISDDHAVVDGDWMTADAIASALAQHLRASD